MSVVADPDGVLATVDRFVARINARDLEGLAAMMTSDHRLTDSLGAVIEDSGPVEAAWKAYFAMVSDYTVSVVRRLADGAEVILLGTAGGSFPAAGRAEETAWSTPVAIRAVVRDSRVCEWQVYADNEPIRRQMRRSASP